MTETTATPTAATAVVEPTATTPTQPVAAPVKTEPQKTAPAKEPAKSPEPVKLVSLLDEPTKPAEQPKPDATKEPAKDSKDSAPEKYEPFQLAEGVTLSPELGDTFGELAKAANLPQAKAQEALSKMAAALEKQNQEQVAAWVNKAAEETRAAEGDQFEANRAKANRAIKLYGSPELEAFLKTPLGLLMVNTKPVWSMLTKMGADVSDDSVVIGSPRSVPAELGASGFYKAIRAQG